LDESQTVQCDVDYCQPCGLKCEESVQFLQECGHLLQNISCDVAFKMARGEVDVPVCTDEVSTASPLCGHNISVPCHFVKDVNSWQPWPELNAMPKYFEITVDSESEARKIYSSPISFPQTQVPSALSPLKDTLVCGSGTWVQFEACGHMQEVPCSELYRMDGDRFQSIACKSLIDHPCGRDCGQHRQIRCHDHCTLSPEELDATCSNPVTLPCRKCNINKVDVPCNQRFPECKARVECMLPCGHAAKPWVCGIDPDPRFGHDGSSGMNENCLHCVKGQWEQSRDVAMDLDFLQLMAKKLLLEEMGGDDTNLLSEIALEPPFVSCDKVRDTIISKYLESMETGAAGLKFPPIVGFPCCIEEYIHSSYDVVFFEIPATRTPDKRGILKRFSLEPTVFGMGKRVSLLRKNLIENLASASGLVKLCIAMAFKTNLLTHTEQFTLDPKQMTQSANNCMREFRRKGFDCVEVQRELTNDVEKEGKAAECLERVYWEAGAIVPLSIVEVQLNTSCIICGEYFGRNGNLGAICSEGHFLCYESCFPGYLASAEEPGAIGRSVQNGHLKCPGDCASCYDPLELSAKNCPRDIAEELFSFEMDFKVTQSNNIVREEEERKKKKEIEDLMKMDELDREVRILCHKITEDIMTPKCPRCKQAFIDFNGCCALTCSNLHCMAGFCAYCFEDCGSDAHSHVAHCPLGAGAGLFSNMNCLNKIWKKVRRDKIQHLLNNGMKTEVKKKLREKMKKDFEELGVVMV
jgi:hypothetical protein